MFVYSLVLPVDVCVEGEADHAGDLGDDGSVTSGLQQKNIVGRVLAQPGRDDGSGRPGPDDDVVVGRPQVRHRKLADTHRVPDVQVLTGNTEDEHSQSQQSLFKHFMFLEGHI